MEIYTCKIFFNIYYYVSATNKLKKGSVPHQPGQSWSNIGSTESDHHGGQSCSNIGSTSGTTMVIKYGSTYLDCWLP
jgi:hypothetical protein